jgi:hypothetical protein
VTALDLTGLKAHHPLGFLAACGLLRCLTESKTFGEIRLVWRRADGEGSFAAVESGQPLSIDSITQQLLLPVSEQQRQSPAWTWSTKIDDRKKYRCAAKQVLAQVFEATSRDAADMLAALASDLVTKGDSLRSTSFDLTSGNQRVLQSFRVLAGEPKGAKDKPAPLTKATVEEALMGPWKYQDDHHSLGWDPEVQRLHALRGKLPEKDKANRSVRAAVFLASQSLPLFPCFAVGGRLRTVGFYRDGEDDSDWFCWPIWREPITLDTLRSLLAHPFNGDLRERGVEVVYRCRRAHTGGSEGDYRIFSRAEERPWPVRPHRRRGRQPADQ